MTIKPVHKDGAIAALAAVDAEGDRATEIAKLVAQLKVALLADEGCNGGLNEGSRRRAWDMVRDIGKILTRSA